MFNLYAYVRNNPLRLVDPDGKDAKGASVKDDKIVELTEEDRKKLQKQLSRIAPGTKVRADGSIKKPNFFQRVANRITGKSGGTDLVGRLVDSKQTTTIAVNNLSLTQTVAGTVAAANNGELVDGNKFEQMAKNGTPTDTIVFWDPNQKVPEGAILNNAASETSPDPASNLAHELIHAEHAVRGSAPKSGLYSQQFTYQGQTYNETETSDEEFRTVGLYGFARPGDITENQIRRELGLRPRISYGGLP